MDIKDFYAQSLGITAPWKVSEVSILAENQTVEVKVECTAKTLWVDPQTQERAHIHGWRERRWRHLDTCEFETWVVAQVPRIKLPSGETMSVSVPWAEDNGRFTLAMEGRLIEVLQQCKSVVAAARLGGITRDQADGVMKRAVERGLARREDAPLKQVGIDEKAIRRGHRYATILTELETGRVIEVAEGRRKEDAARLLQKLPSTVTESIEAVAMDMWAAYIGAVATELPNAAIVFDRFHVKKHLNDAVDQVRRRENRELSAAGNRLLKGTKYQWLKTHEDMRRRSAREFRALLVHELQTGTAWSLKQMFDHFWSYRSLSGAMRFFNNWSDSVTTSALQPMQKVAKMLQTHLDGLLNYVAFPITNAAAEAINSLIQPLRTAARGLPNFENFRARILFHLGQLNMQPA